MCLPEKYLQNYSYKLNDAYAIVKVTDLREAGRRFAFHAIAAGNGRSLHHDAVMSLVQMKNEECGSQTGNREVDVAETDGPPRSVQTPHEKMD